jgi:NADH:ubiquinone oxidoreductase subunit 3 (subunit A)
MHDSVVAFVIFWFLAGALLLLHRCFSLLRPDANRVRNTRYACGRDDLGDLHRL